MLFRSGIVLLTLAGYQDGVITMTRDDEVYCFIVVDNDMLYDKQTEEFLTRGM